MDAKRSSAADRVPDHLLAWYDVAARDLPWRARPGEVADPYRVWLSEVMLQQTTVATVRPRFAAWAARWPDVASLAAADEADVMAAWAGLGYYARARNLVKAARAVVADHGGAFPRTETALRALPGLGAYTAASVAAIAFGEPAVVVDANVERVVARLFAIETPLPAARPAIRAAAATITPRVRAGDFAQGMMDLGATICTNRRPRCLLCPIRVDCSAHAQGIQERLPAKAAKRAKPQRHGTIFWLEHDGRVLLVRRPDKGLLGGMRAFPTGPWSDEPPGLAEAPVAAEWRWRPERVAHGFTHFDLDLALAIAEPARLANDVAGEWWPIDDLESAGLPTLFAKAARAIIDPVSRSSA
ncbi:A/G-specific adenine glycosylase [Sphingomonas sp. Leaf339]|uniref:A/G-specific adenine glycosylase n=1 Tax=Sphingomonas sp. Leaf339 TaxID=1736343 RepID=UPI0006F5B3CC|nr:A/G-specific adenine glycosylase [Sphingomonas sp. Leaf339]KQU48277.1 A/G-specific adenine glycosylase [Sphingomonas sp. Leaf339]